MNKNNKFVALILTLIIFILCLTSCKQIMIHNNTPEEAVETFLNFMKDNNYSRAYDLEPECELKYLKSLTTNGFSNSDSELYKFNLKQSSKLKYETKDVDIKKDFATVTVKCKYVNLKPLIKTIVEDSYEKTKDMEKDNFNGKRKVIKEVSKQTIKNYTEEYKEETITIDLQKRDNKWYIGEISESLDNVLSKNVACYYNETEGKYYSIKRLL